ncbi:MAG: hypothetical protein ABIR30_14295 [Chitinophagaceae bacterium]
MKQVTFIAVCLAAAQFSFARPPASKTPVYNGYKDSVVVAIPSPQQLLQEIMSVTGLQAGFELKEADVPNILASISRHKRLILYSSSYVNWLNNVTRSKWPLMALLAHEVGHHLNGHTIRKGGSSPAVELEADEFAGFVLYKLGATLEQSQEVMKYIAGLKGSDTHPGRLARMQAIQSGWNKAAGTSSIAAVKKINTLTF